MEKKELVQKEDDDVKSGYDRVILERVYIPMKDLFMDHLMKEKIASIFIKDSINIIRYMESPRSFAQYFALSDEKQVSENGKNKILEVLAEFDKLNPVLLCEFYPFLKEKEWIIFSNQISYFTSYVMVEENQFIAVSEIQKRMDENNRIEFIVIQRDTMERYCYPVMNELQIEKVMKNLLLYGEANVWKDLRS